MKSFKHLTLIIDSKKKTQKRSRFLPQWLDDKADYYKDRSLHTLTQCGHTLTQCGHTLTQCGHTLTQCGHMLTQCYHRFTPCGHMLTQCGHRFTPCGHRVKKKEQLTSWVWACCGVRPRMPALWRKARRWGRMGTADLSTQSNSVLHSHTAGNE